MTLTSIKNVMRNKSAEIKELEVFQKSYRPQADLSKNDFWKLMYLNMKKKMILTNDFHEYEINDYHNQILEQLYYHLTMNPKFKGDLDKGIWLYGETGRGKSTILEAYMYTIEDVTNRTFINVHAKELSFLIDDFGYDYFARRPLFIDDAGRETKELKVFGNKTIPMMEIIQLREKSGAFTLATSNKLFDKITFQMWDKGVQITTTYGAATIRRAKKLFNFIELKGNDRTL